jgi:hypothetical protein
MADPWVQQLAALFPKHSDTIAVVRAGRKAKRRTNRRDRQQAKRDIRTDAAMTGPDKDEVIELLSQTARNRMEEIRRLREERGQLRGELVYWLVEMTRRIEHCDKNGLHQGGDVLMALKVDYEARIKRLPGAEVGKLADARKLAEEMAAESGPVTEVELEELRKVWPEDG